MRSGSLNKRARFEALVRVPDGGGGAVETWEEFTTVWAQFSPERARERIQVGRLASAFGGVLRIRSSAMSRLITQKHRVVLDSITFNIRSISNPDQQNDMLEMSIETDGSAG